MIFLSSRLFSKIPNFRSRYYYFFHYPPSLPLFIRDVDRAESWMTRRHLKTECLREFVLSVHTVVCFGEIVFVVSLENSLQFHPCIFFPLVGFVFEEDFSGFGFRVCFFLFLFFLFVRCCVELWITIAGELNTELKRISGIINGVRYDGARVSSNI